MSVRYAIIKPLVKSWIYSMSVRYTIIKPLVKSSLYSMSIRYTIIKQLVKAGHITVNRKQNKSDSQKYADLNIHI